MFAVERWIPLTSLKHQERVAWFSGRSAHVENTHYHAAYVTFGAGVAIIECPAIVGRHD